MGSFGKVDSAVLSESGPGPSALRVVVDAADTLCAAVLQPPPSRGQALSDLGMEDLLYEAESVRRFVGLRLSGPLPDETTILNFRHLLKERQLGHGLMKEINATWHPKGCGCGREP